MAELEVEARGGRKPNLCICGYYVLCLLVTGSLSAIAACIWSSSMGIGIEAFKALEKGSSWGKWSFGICFVMVLVLYVLDFFWPPHLPGCFFSLWQGDTFCGRLIFCTMGVFLLFAVLLMTPTYPYIPVVITTVLSPVCVGLVHFFLHSEQVPKGQQLNEVIEQGDLRAKMILLKSILGEENDTLAFFKAAAGAFMTTSIILAMLWLVMIAGYGEGPDELERGTTSKETGMIHILWATPLVVAVSYFVMSLFSLLRVFMQKSYNATNMHRNMLIAETLESSMHAELMACHVSSFTAIHTEMHDNSAWRDKYLTQHVQHIKQLSMLVKVVFCIFVLLIGIIYVVSQLLCARVAYMIGALVSSLFFVYFLFIWVAFNRIVKAMGQWIQDLPVWKVLKNIMDWPVTQATFICLVLPMIPIVLLLSWLNQQVRIWRGLYKASYLQESSEDLASFSLTPRIHAMAKVLCHWNWLKIIRWCYILCGIHVCSTICPMLLNAGLAWLRSITASWHFAVIVAATFVIGLAAFLLPMVPGLSVYIFGGLVISGSCPPVLTARGFWVGSVVNILMCWILKMVACAVQQVCIGRMLGKSLWVRRTVGVHKVAIRCIEAELKTPGLSVGKVAILCGGPDWPTSVLAGVLQLSLWQCELGTLPIIGLVMPCALAGSLYIKRGEGEIWARSANMMIVASAVISLILWAIAFWAIQNRFEANSKELNTRLLVNVDLHWLDYLEEELARRSAITWHDLPMVVRSLYISGAVSQIIVCHGLNWGYSHFFGSFHVQDEIETLVLWPSPGSDNELFTWLSIAALSVYLLAFANALQFYLWRRFRIYKPLREAMKDLNLSEAQWKEAFRLELEQEEALRSRNKTVKLTGNADAMMLEDLIEEIAALPAANTGEPRSALKAGPGLQEVEVPEAPPPTPAALLEPEAIPAAVARLRTAPLRELTPSSLT